MSEPLPLADQILLAIAQATGNQPRRASDVRRSLEAGEPDFWKALDLLIVDKLVATATLYRPKQDAAPWLAIWPTGKPPQHRGRLNGEHLSSLFVRQPPMSIAIRAAHAPRARAA